MMKSNKSVSCTSSFSKEAVLSPKDEIILAKCLLVHGGFCSIQWEEKVKWILIRLARTTYFAYMIG